MRKISFQLWKNDLMLPFLLPNVFRETLTLFPFFTYSCYDTTRNKLSLQRANHVIFKVNKQGNFSQLQCNIGH